MLRPRTLLLLSVSLLLALGMLWGQGVFSAVSPPPPTVGTPVVQPAIIMVNHPTLLTVTSRITSSPSHPVVPASVKLERVDTQGKIVANLGTMYDNGTHGDTVAGDGIFTVQVSLTESTPGTLRLQVAATFRAGPGRITSGIALVPIVTQTNTPPVANAGPDQTVVVGPRVPLDGRQSRDVDGDALQFRWSFLAMPFGSTATLSDPTAVQPTFIVDRPGTYTVQLIVNDGQVESAPDTVDINTQNSRPVANAGPDQTVVVGPRVPLDGRQSRDVDGDALSYRWSFTATPAGSLATFDDPTAVTPTFVVDHPGTYTVQLIVNDGTVDSDPDIVVISTQNSRPVADAGPEQTVAVGESVQLDGRASHDADADPLTYQWALTVQPPRSPAALSDPTRVDPTFPADQPGTYVAQLMVNDGQVDSSPATTAITAGVPPQVRLEPADGAVLNTATPLITITYQDPGSGIDLTSLRVTLDSVEVTARFTITATQATYRATLADGVHHLTVTLRNLAGLDAQATAQCTIDTLPPPPIAQASLTVGPVTNGHVTITGAPGSTEGGALVTLVNTRTGQQVQVRATAVGGFTGVLAAQQGDGVRLTSTDLAGNTSTAVTVPIGVPPDPVLVAPPLDRNVATLLATATAFLYTGANPIQTGVAAGTIELTRAAVIRGRVQDRQNNALPGVTITMLNHPEYGQTLSRSDGQFDLAVNGGGDVIVDYRKEGYLSAQRQLHVPWQDYAFAPDVVLLPTDSRVTTIDLTDTLHAFQVARGSVQNDSAGTRQATLLIPKGSQAHVVLPDGSTQPISLLSIRATEFTVGPNGPKAMPAELPPTSGYTYAVVFTADEAKAAGAKDVVFSQPLPLYVENFLGFTTGVPVPLGAYDPDQGRWMASDRGVVLKITGITAGAADLDTDGDGLVENGVALGISLEERQQLASLYGNGQSLWRMVIPHFDRPWDANLNTDCKLPCEFPNQKEPVDQLDDPCVEEGSIIECENQVLGESLALVGTPFRLHYRSSRVPGALKTTAYDIQLSGSTVLPGLLGITLEVSVGGRLFAQSFPAQANLRTRFVWDGQDAYGRTPQGSQAMTVRIGYVYEAVYRRTERFGYNGNGLVTADGSSSRQTMTLWQQWQKQVGHIRFSDLLGWSVDVQHRYDPVGLTLYLGDGRQRHAQYMERVMTTVAGGVRPPDGSPGSGDGGPAEKAQLTAPIDVAVAPDGALYIAQTIVQGYARIRKVTPDGLIHTAANVPGGVGQLAMGPEGRLYFLGSYNQFGATQVLRLEENGTVTPVAGRAYDTSGFGGDNGPATVATFSDARGLAVGPDGSVYIGANGRIRKVSPDGIITTVAFTGPYTVPVAAGPDGSVYFQSAGLYTHLMRMTPTGSITVVVQLGVFVHGGDLAVDPVDGGVYVRTGTPPYQVYKVLVNGGSSPPPIVAVAGNGAFGFSGDGGAGHGGRHHSGRHRRGAQR